VNNNDWAHRKSIAQAIRDLEQESAATTLKRVLGPLDLVLVGVGAIIGGGIFCRDGQRRGAIRRTRYRAVLRSAMSPSAS